MRENVAVHRQNRSSRKSSRCSPTVNSFASASRARHGHRSRASVGSIGVAADAPARNNEASERPHVPEGQRTDSLDASRKPSARRQGRGTHIRARRGGSAEEARTDARRKTTRYADRRRNGARPLPRRGVTIVSEAHCLRRRRRASVLFTYDKTHGDPAHGRAIFATRSMIPRRPRRRRAATAPPRVSLRWRARPSVLVGDPGV